MNKKKLSRSSSLQSSVTSVLAALLCILIGLLVGFLVLVAINPAHAWGDGFVRIIKGGFHDAPYGVGKELANAAPLIMTGLSVAFAFKTGLFNIGAAGQYTLGAYGALYCAIMLKLPWFVCLLAAAVLGGLWGAIPGFFKAYFNINEVITSIMFNWIGLYLVNELVYQNGTGPMYDVRNTRTLNLGKNADLAQSVIPDFGLNKLFQTNSTTIAIFLAAVVAILIWVVLNKTTFGYELKAVGLNKSAARYAGINEKKNIILSMAIAGALAGFGAGLFYLSNVGQWNPLNSTSLPAMGFNGISVALLASSHWHHLLGPVHLPHLCGRHLPFHQVLSHGDRRPDQRHHHLPVCILHAVPRQDPEAAVQECGQDQCERRACPGGKGQREEGGQVRCCF